MSGTITAKKVVTDPYFSLICVLALFVVLPEYGMIAMMIGSACIVSAQVVGLPEHFRSRSGSLWTASCLVAAMWVGAAIITVLTLMGAIQN